MAKVDEKVPGGQESHERSSPMLGRLEKRPTGQGKAVGDTVPPTGQ